MKAKTWLDVDGKWGWSILDESWATLAEARQEMYAALEDWT